MITTLFENSTFLQIFSYLITLLLILNIALFVLNISLRLWKGNKNSKVNDKNNNYKLMAIMGSGGHTTEMIKLLNSTIDNEKKSLFSDRVYVIADSDKLSSQKVHDFEGQIENNNFIITKIPRARNVGQSFYSSIPTTLLASWYSAKLLWMTRPDIIICNGPAISFPICLFARFFNLLRIKKIKIIFVESICRVHSLSLTGRLLYFLRIPNAFLVQWPSLHKKYKKSQFIGRLV